MSSLLSFIIVLGILIFVHELGHYSLAKLLGVGVERFSIGFGPKLFSWNLGGTDFRLSAIPLGGYVKMVGDDPEAELPEEKIPLSFTHKPVWKRILIVAAGPFFNLLLAIVLLWILIFYHGLFLREPVIGHILKDSPAALAGLKTGDFVLAVDGQKVDSWEDMMDIVHKTLPGEALIFSYKRKGEFVELKLYPELMPYLDKLGESAMRMDIGAYPFIPPVVAYVKEGFPADLAGIKEGDQVLSINGEVIESWNLMATLIQESEGENLAIDIKRDGELISFNIRAQKEIVEDIPGTKRVRYLLGISPESLLKTYKPGIFASFSTSVKQTGEIAYLTGLGIARILKGKLSKDNIGGPVMIARLAGSEARKGISSLMAFIAVISVNLALLNLLPIPVLDGGHLLFYTIELLIGRPVSVRSREIAQQIGFFLLLSLMIFAFYNDIIRLISS